MADTWTKTSYAVLSYNTATRLLADNLSPVQKLYGQPAHHRSSQEWQTKLQASDQQREHTLASSESFYNTHAQSLPYIHK